MRRKTAVSVLSDVYRGARNKALQLGTSVSALARDFRDFLEKLGSEDSDFARRLRLQDEALETVESFRTRDRLNRHDVHDRDALR